MTTTILLVRHGETNFNLEGKIQGHSTESVLTPKGIQGGNKLGEALKLSYIVDIIISSDLPRAADTAKILADKLNIPRDSIIYDQRVREMYRGVWEGNCPYNSNEWKVFEKKLNQGVDYAPEGINIESYTSAMKRSKSLFDDLILQYKNKTILVSSHGEINKVFLGVSQNHNIQEVLLNDRKKYVQQNCCINEIIIDNGSACITKADYLITGRQNGKR